MNSHILAKIVVILLSVLWALATALDFLLIVVSPMMFDAPGSRENPVVIAAFWAVILFPVVTLITIGISNVLLEKKMDIAAVLRDDHSFNQYLCVVAVEVRKFA